MLNKLKSLRQERNISQQTLADIVGVSQQSINQYENHRIEPDIEVLKKMAQFFDTSIDYIVGNTEIRCKISESGYSNLIEDERMLLQGYRALSEREREYIRAIMKAFLKK